MIIGDIKNYLFNEKQYQINQELIRFKALFQDFVTKNLFSSNADNQRDYKHNIIVMKECMEFYYEY